MQRSILLLCLCGLAPLVSGCRASGESGRLAETRTESEQALDWQIGLWHGTRRDAGAGTENRMLVVVAPILGGVGQALELEIEHEGGTYRGFWVQICDAESDRWTCRYANDVRRAHVPLAGEGYGERMVWMSATPGVPPRTRLVSERLGSGRWRRTSFRSTDGETWSELFVDELQRVGDASIPLGVGLSFALR